MKKKVLTVLLTGAMVASMAAGATVVSAEDNDNTLTVWAWDQNFSFSCFVHFFNFFVMLTKYMVFFH